MQSASRKTKTGAAAHVAVSPGHITQGDIFDDLGSSAEETLEAKIKSDIWQALMKHIEHERFTQAKLAKALKCHQPDVSNLLSGKISRFSITKLIQFAGWLDLTASVKIEASGATKKAATMNAAAAERRKPKRGLVRA